MRKYLLACVAAATASIFGIGVASATPMESIPVDGTYMVGSDIAPGLWHTSGSGGQIDCYWERDKDMSGTTDSILANNDSAGPQTVQIAAADAAFQTQGCAPWARIG